MFGCVFVNCYTIRIIVLGPLAVSMLARDTYYVVGNDLFLLGITVLTYIYVVRFCLTCFRVYNVLQLTIYSVQYLYWLFALAGT